MSPVKTKKAKKRFIVEYETPPMRAIHWTEFDDCDSKSEARRLFIQHSTGTLKHVIRKITVAPPKD